MSVTPPNDAAEEAAETATEQATENEATEAKPPIELDRAKRMFREAMNSTQENDLLCLRDSKFYHGDQISDAERAELARRSQPEVYINRLKPALNGILGIYDAAESDPQAYPRNPQQQDAADVVTKLLRYLGEKGDIKDARRTLSENYFLEGTCAVLIGDGAQHGDKSIRITPILWEDFFGDPLSRHNDWRDARYLGIAKWLDTDTLSNLYPEAYKELGDPFDSSFDVFTTKNDLEERSRWIDTNRRRIRVIEMYYADGSGTWQRLVFCQRGWLDHGESVYRDDEGNSICPIVAVSYALRRDTGSRYGALRDAISPQREINSRRSKLLHLTNSRQVQTTTENADPKKVTLAKTEAAKADGVMPFGYEARSLTDIAEGQTLLLHEAQADIDRMAPSPAILGRLGSGDSGRSLDILQKAGYTEWARAFARLETLESEIYKRLWFCARQFMTGQMFIRITGDQRTPKFLEVNTPTMGMVPQPVMGPDGQPVIDPRTGQPAIQMAQGVVRVENEIASMDMDIILATVPHTPTLELEVWQEMLRYAASMQVRVSDPEFKFMIMASPLTNKTSTIERMDAIREQANQENAAQQQQQAAMQQQQMQLEAQHSQAKAAKDMANARKANASAMETEAELYEMQMNQHFMRGFHGLNPPPPHVG